MEWFSQKLFLKSKGKIKYVLGTTPVLALEDSSFKTWDAENSMVMSWLLLFHSMKLEISKIYLLMTTTKEICGAVTQTYSKLGITGKLYPCHKTRILYCHSVPSKKCGWSWISIKTEMESTANIKKLKKFTGQREGENL